MAEQNPTREPDARLALAIQEEGHKFQKNYLWLEESMPADFFQEIGQDYLLLIAHHLIDFHLQDYFTAISIDRGAIVLCLDSADADLRILAGYTNYGIKTYRSFLSSKPPPVPQTTAKLRIGIILFTQAEQATTPALSQASTEELRALVKERNPSVTDADCAELIASIDAGFLRALPMSRLVLAFDLFFRAKTHDNCQYEVCFNEGWPQKNEPAVQIILAWRNTPKQNFVYRLARLVHRHRLTIQRVNASYIDPHTKQSILMMTLSVHHNSAQAAWDKADMRDFLSELVTIKYFDDFDLIDRALVIKGVINGNQGNLIRSMAHFIHQALVNLDTQLYRIENIEEALCRHPELIASICRLFALKFDPDQNDLAKYRAEHASLLEMVDRLDTGQEENDLRRKNVLMQAIHFIHFTLKTNYYRRNYTAHSFRLDPAYLDQIPFDRKSKFPELPYGIFYIRGMHFFAFHIRFKELSRGGLRTVYPEQEEHMVLERNNVFAECYNLAYTQQKKNKDIPEGGSKAVVFLKPFVQLEAETKILRIELSSSAISEQQIKQKLAYFRREQEEEYLHHAQRSFIESLLTLIKGDDEGHVKAKYIVDYWKQPEYIYLGPDERMDNSMIAWIADFARNYQYKPGAAFISSKPLAGFNHKEYGVTSLGLNVYVDELLKYLGIDPQQETFTVKMCGGPDGDVAGNQILNLHRYYPNTAKLLALTDISGTIYDPVGLDLAILAGLFQQNLPIKFYPPVALHEGGYLLDRQNTLVQQTLCWHKRGGQVEEEWLSGNDMNHLFRHNVHQTPTDLFIPAGGRPRTLNEANYKDFFDEKGKPTSRAIVEGANLYLTETARRKLEEAGVLIIKDSSANKGGVITSSFEVLCGLVLTDAEFTKLKLQLVSEVLAHLQQCALKEARALLKNHRETGMHLTESSDLLSEKINRYTYQLLDYLDAQPLSKNIQDPLIRCFLSYCLPILREKFVEKLMSEVPEHHKKAIISCHLAATLVYERGINWVPSVLDILPVLLQKF